MKILLIGNTGQLGWDLERSLLPVGDVIGVDLPDIDLLEKKSISHWVQKVKPDVIVNAAAYTAVDLAEIESELAYQINAVAPGFIAEQAASTGAMLIHFSTNHVFDGKKKNPYQETDPPNPINYYGESKLTGEQKIEQVGGNYFIFRTSWLYSTRTDSFLTKVLNWSRIKEVLRIVDDQVSTPTWSKTLAEKTAEWLIRTSEQGRSWMMERTGIYHLAGVGPVSRYEWAEKILQLDPKRNEQILTALEPATSDEFPTPAKRPEYSALNSTFFQDVFGLVMPPWLKSLEMALSSVEK